MSLDLVAEEITQDRGGTHLALVGDDGVIVSVNRAWATFAAENGADPDATGPGSDYLAVCGAPGPDGSDGTRTATAIRAALAGARERVVAVYPCHSSTAERWFEVRVRGVADGRAAVVEHLPVSAEHLRTMLRDTLQLLAAPGADPAPTQALVAGLDLEAAWSRATLPRLGELRDAVGRTLQRRPVSLASVVSSVATTRPGLRGSVSVVSPDALATVDDRLLAPLLGELLQNVVDHADGGARVAFETAGSGIRLLVDDDGPGIPDDQRELAVRPSFEPGSPPRLGLPIARALAHHHGGWLLVQDAPGGGTRVRVEL